MPSLIFSVDTNKASTAKAGAVNKPPNKGSIDAKGALSLSSGSSHKSSSDFLLYSRDESLATMQVADSR